MKPCFFYGQKDYPNAGRDEEKSDDSGDDPDYIPQGTTKQPQYMLSDSSSTESDNDDVPSTSANTQTKRKLSWKTIENESCHQYNSPSWQSQLEIPDNIKSPIEQFYYFFDEDFLDQIVNQSNLYAIQTDPTKPLRLTKSELEKFIGCCLYMSVFKLPRSRMYWGMNTRVDAVASIMSRVRWEQIKSNLHFNDNDNMPEDTDPNRDRLFKLRPIIDHLLSKFQALPQKQTLCVDEQMVPYKGRSKLKQYLPKKPHKWGYKIFIMCDVEGLVYNFEVYTGKILPVSGHPDLGASSNIVLQLVQIVNKNVNLILYCDNWFSSLQLFVVLAKSGIYAAGTIRSNRLKGCSFSGDMSLKKKGRGSYEEKETTIDGIPLRAVKWFDNRPVVLASTFAKATPVGYAQRWDRKIKRAVSVQYPNIVKQYNTFMGGVDTLDAYLAYYRTHIRSKKYYLRFFFHFCDMVVVNSWLLYRRECEALCVPKKMQLDQMNFKLNVSNHLCKLSKSVGRPRKRGRPSASLIQSEFEMKKRRGPAKPIPDADIRQDQVGHMPIVMDKRQRCKRPGCKGQTVFKCIKCEVHRCLNKNCNCFVVFHE